MHFTFLPLALLLTAARAAPAPNPQFGSCYKVQTYKVSSVSDPYGIEPKLASGARCTSSDTEDCGVGITYSYTQGTIQTVTFSPGFLIGKTFLAAANAGYSTAWTTSDTTGTTTNVNCPKGHITCAARVTPYMRKVKGTVDFTWNEACDTGKVLDTKDFEIEVPAIVEGVPENQQAIMDFEACAIKAPSGVDFDIPPCP